MSNELIDRVLSDLYQSRQDYRRQRGGPVKQLVVMSPEFYHEILAQQSPYLELSLDKREISGHPVVVDVFNEVNDFEVYVKKVK